MNKTLKYVNTQEVFQEFPDEITLAINISKCPCHCPGCHSNYLAEDIGEPLNIVSLYKLIEDHPGISCVGFMGGDLFPEIINALASLIRQDVPKLKIGWYSGRPFLSEMIDLRNFDYVKLGPYVEELGGLDSKKTNQVLYRVSGGKFVENLNYRFWRE